MNKKCAFFENRICDDSCMAYTVIESNWQDKPDTATCKRLIIKLDDKTPTIF